jgi:hypothetical protein
MRFKILLVFCAVTGISGELAAVCPTERIMLDTEG